MSEREKQPEATEAAEAPQKAPRKKASKGKIAAVVVVIVVVIAVAGGAFWTWHETPGFCSAFCHNMDNYVNGYYQQQNTAGVDKYGNAVSNTNAMLSVVHRQNDTTAKSEITCLDCHHAVLGEQVTEGVEFITGDYMDPLTERVGGDLTKWWGEDEDRFCANENCHSYLMGANGKIDRDFLERSTAMRDFNPHSQHHNIKLACTQCHKGHRASVLMCTACHEHENVELPDGWVSASESEDLMNLTFLSA